MFTKNSMLFIFIFGMIKKINIFCILRDLKRQSKYLKTAGNFLSLASRRGDFEFGPIRPAVDFLQREIENMNVRKYLERILFEDDIEISPACLTKLQNLHLMFPGRTWTCSLAGGRS